jgi:hypothetical protein
MGTLGGGFCLFVFVILGIEPSASHLLGNKQF